MIEKIKSNSKLSNQDRQLPQTIQELVNRYDLENIEVTNKINELIDFLKESSKDGKESDYDEVETW